MDAAFKTAKYSGYTTAQMKSWIAEGLVMEQWPEMLDEITRREMVAAGHQAVMTPGERLRFNIAIPPVFPK